MPPPPALQTLIFEVTQRCNHACQHCYNAWHAAPYPQGELDTRDTLALLDRTLEQVRCSHVTLTGGEPLMRADLPQIVRWLRRRGVRVTLITNGHLLDEARVVDLLERGVSLFEVPLLSTRREVHDTLSGAAGAFDAVLSAMAQIRYHGGRFVAVFVAMRPNLADARAVARSAFALGSQGMMFNRFNPGGAGRARMDALLPTVRGLRTALRELEALSAALRFPISCSIPIQPCLIDPQAYPHLTFGFCALGTAHAYYTLDPLGNLRPCNHTAHVLGNLWEESFADLTAPERLALLVAARPSFCDPCAVRDTCQGGCKAAAQVCRGSWAAEEPFLHRHRDRATPLRRAP